MREWLGNCHVLFVEILLLYELLAISSNLHCLPFSQKNNNIVLNPNFVSARGRGAGRANKSVLDGFCPEQKKTSKKQDLETPNGSAVHLSIALIHGGPILQSCQPTPLVFGTRSPSKATMNMTRLFPTQAVNWSSHVSIPNFSPCPISTDPIIPQHSDNNSNATRMPMYGLNAMYFSGDKT